MGYHQSDFALSSAVCVFSNQEKKFSLQRHIEFKSGHSFLIFFFCLEYNQYRTPTFSFDISFHIVAVLSTYTHELINIFIANKQCFLESVII